MKKLFLVLFAITAIPLSAQAGAEGHGENAVVCFDSKQVFNQVLAQGGRMTDNQINQHVVSVTAYDLYQAMRPKGDDPTNPTLYISSYPGPMPYSLKSARDFSEKIAQRFDSTLPGISKTIRDGLRTFSPQTVVWDKSGLFYVDDADPEGYLPDNCGLATLANQDNSGDTYSLTLDQRFFNLPEVIHSGLSKGVTLLHETLYLVARQRGQTTSKNTRAILAILITQNSSQMTVAQLIKVFDDLGFGNIISGAPGNKATSVLIAAVNGLSNDMYKKFADQWLKSQQGIDLAQRSDQFAKDNNNYGCDETVTPFSCYWRVQETMTNMVNREYFTPDQVQLGKGQKLISDWMSFYEDTFKLAQAFGVGEISSAYAGIINQIPAMPQSTKDTVVQDFISAVQDQSASLMMPAAQWHQTNYPAFYLVNVPNIGLNEYLDFPF